MKIKTRWIVLLMFIGMMLAFSIENETNLLSIILRGGAGIALSYISLLLVDFRIDKETYSTWGSKRGH